MGPGDTIQERLALGYTPDAAPPVRVFLNGPRYDTVTLTGVATGYDVVYAISDTLLATDFLQVIAFPKYLGVTYPVVLFSDRLGAGIAIDETSVACALIAEGPLDSNPTAATWLDGASSVSAAVATGAAADEFTVTVDPSGLEGTLRCDATKTIGGLSSTSTLWEFVLGATAPPPPTTPPPPVLPASNWVEPSGWFRIGREVFGARTASTVVAKTGESPYFAFNLTPLPEVGAGGATATAAAITCSGATVGPVIVNPARLDAAAGQAVEAHFTSLIHGTYDVTLDVILSTNVRRKIVGSLRVNS
jgi:hypothetical protein